MAIRTERSVIYHIPKCGGTWVQMAIGRAGLYHDRCVDKAVKHKELRNEFGLMRKHSVSSNMWPEEVKGLFHFCFVRHPLTWYNSVWRFRRVVPVPNSRFPIDRYWVPNYEEFITNILNDYPEGYVTKLFQFYVGENLDGVDFIGRQENLANDLVKALTLAGETFDEDALRATKRKNISKKFNTVLSEETQNRVLETEKWVIDSFYSGRKDA